MSIIRSTISDVYSSEYIHGFWRVAVKFFKFEFLMGALQAYTINWFFKTLLVVILFIFNTIGAFVFLGLSIILTLTLTAYLIPRVIFAAIGEIF